jgi:hypothetical protein
MEPNKITRATCILAQLSVEHKNDEFGNLPTHLFVGLALSLV